MCSTWTMMSCVKLRPLPASTALPLSAHHGDALDTGTYAGEFDFITSTGLGEFLDDEQLAALYRFSIASCVPEVSW